MESKDRQAEIINLWDGDTEVISGCDSIADLKKCSNAIVGQYSKDYRAYECLINNDIVYISAQKRRHPTSGDIVRCLVVF